MNLELHPYLYGHKVGTLLLEAGRVYFEYDKVFKTLGWEISPMKLPLDTTRLYTNKDDVAYYGGLAGVFHDSLPEMKKEQVLTIRN